MCKWIFCAFVPLALQWVCFSPGWICGPRLPQTWVMYCITGITLIGHRNFSSFVWCSEPCWLLYSLKLYSWFSCHCGVQDHIYQEREIRGFLCSEAEKNLLFNNFSLFMVPLWMYQRMFMWFYSYIFPEFFLLLWESQLPTVFTHMMLIWPFQFSDSWSGATMIFLFSLHYHWSFWGGSRWETVTMGFPHCISSNSSFPEYSFICFSQSINGHLLALLNNFF